MQFKDILKYHLNKYVIHTPEDIYKLIYQGEFAGGHIILNKAQHLVSLKRELMHVKNQSYKGIERISETHDRLYLDGFIKVGMNINTIQKMVLKSAENNHGKIHDFESKLKVWRCFEDIDNFVFKMRTNNYPLVHHSEAYQKAYQPAYRIIAHSYGFYLDLFVKIDQMLMNQEHLVIAIDGDAGSGKSELANLLKSIYECDIIHMDDFFLQNQQRTPQRLQEIGGNIDDERFENEVIIPLKEKRSFTYKPYDCQTSLFANPIRVDNNHIIVVEGSYSLHEKFKDAYDIKLYLKVDSKAQLNRLKKRNNPQLVPRFINEWIPKEKAYAEFYNIEKHADFVFDTTTLK